MSVEPTSALVVGASGMLIESVSWCSTRFARVIATCSTEESAARLRSLGTNVSVVRADWADHDAWWEQVESEIGDDTVALAVVWMHSAAGELNPRRCHSMIADEGLFVWIRGHAAADPESGELAAWIDNGASAEPLPDKRERGVILGWHEANGGCWLSSEEIGTGVVAHLEAWIEDSAKLPVAWVGTVRPWEGRPPGWS